MCYPFQIKSLEQYHTDYKKSIDEPEAFWSSIAENFTWQKKWDKVLEWNFTEPKIEWFKGAKLNITENCLDRHLEKNADAPAIIWEPNNPHEQSVTLSYKELHRQVCIAAQMLTNIGVQKGDRVCIYMGMIPELAIAVLACARIGAIHSVIFGGFSAQSIADRLQDAQATFIITCDGAFRGAKDIPLKAIVDEALQTCAFVKKIIIVERTKTKINFNTEKDIWWHEGIINAAMNNEQLPIAYFDAEDPLFILYTSGSTGKPKGVVHTCAGYLVWATYTFVNVFQYKPGDIHFCTADIGWITGHSYILYGPLSAGATTVMFEGIPTWPNAGRFWEIIEKHKINILYTAPTAIRSLMSFGTEPIVNKNLSSLITLGTVGEPINEEAWHWYYENIGKQNCPVVDTWWQTETGGVLISNLAGITPSKPSWATLPLPGVQPVLVDEKGNELKAPSQPSPEGKELEASRPRNTARASTYGLLKKLKDDNKKNPSLEENILWQQLRNNNLGYHFRKQHIIDEYIVDFVCLQKMFTIEVDGGYHTKKEQIESDKNRTTFLNGLGYTEIRFTNDEVRNDLDKVVTTIKNKLAELADAGKVSPTGGDLEGAIISGNLCIKFPWPGMLRTTWGNHERCRENYFATYPNLYFTGDGVLKDTDGNYRITGRVDDVLNVSGHRIGTAEVENAINMHELVIESAVVGYPHDIKGQGIYAYVICTTNDFNKDNIRNEILQTVTKVIGAIAKPDKIQFVTGLPKTRSGKIMRRILRKIAEGEVNNLGDTTTLLDPNLVDEIKNGKL